MRPFSCVLLIAVFLWPSALPSAHAQGASDPTIYTVSYIDIAPTAKDQAAAIIRQHGDESRRAAAAMRIDVLRRTAPSNQFLILATWKDQGSLGAYTSGAQARQFRDKLGSLLIAPVDERLCIATHVEATRSPSPSGSIHVVTHVDVPGAFRDQILPALATLAQASRRDAGNLRFDVLHQEARTNHFTVVEVWKDQASDDAHELAVHTRQFRSVLSPITGALYDQRWYKSL